MGETKKNRRKLGNEQEERAAFAMKQEGYLILERNYHCRRGEIDIIAKKDSYLVFAEVKFRTNFNCGMPSEAVNYRKQQRISYTALYYMMEHQIPERTPVRFDVIDVLRENVKIWENAFDFCPYY